MAWTGICAFCGAAANDATTPIYWSRGNVDAFAQTCFAYWRCPDCEAILARDRVDLSALYTHYPVHRGASGASLRAFYAQIHRARLSLLRRGGLKSQAAIYDFGEGAGDFVAYLNARGYRAVGADPFARSAPAPSRVDPPGDGGWDAFTAQDVIEHLEQPLTLFDTAQRLLRPGGLLAIGCPDARQIRLEPPAGRAAAAHHLEAICMDMHAPFHRAMPSFAGLCRAAQAAGFAPIAMRRHFPADSLWPSVNTATMIAYARASGNRLEALYAPIDWGKVLTHPRIWGAALWGGVFRHCGHMQVLFRKV